MTAFCIRNLSSLIHQQGFKTIPAFLRIWSRKLSSKQRTYKWKGRWKGNKQLFICSSFLAHCILEGKALLSALVLVTQWLFSYSRLCPVPPSPWEVLLIPFKVHLLLLLLAEDCQHPCLSWRLLIAEILSFATTWHFLTRAGSIGLLREVHSLSAPDGSASSGHPF